MSIKFPNILPLIAIILGLCSACADDVSDHSTPQHESTLTLCVPTANYVSSRAEGSSQSEELLYSSLVFFAYPTLDNGQPDATKPAVITHLPTDPDNLDYDSGSYRKYAVKLPKGRYHFYLVGNIYTTDSELPATEAELQTAIYNLPEDFDCHIPSQGIPMSASHDDFFVKTEGTQTSVPTIGYEYTGDGGEVYALLTYLYAKITVVATDAAGDPAQLTDIKFSNVSEKEPTIFRTDYSEYGTIDEIAIASETSDSQEGDATDEGSSFAESMTFYIPERYVDSTTPSSQSNLSFKIGNKQLLLPLGEVAGNTADGVNTLPQENELRTIKRGTHYKYTLTTSDRITLEVAPWSPEAIVTELNGPVFLHVEKQAYPVIAGEETAVWFESDAENVRLESPKYEFDGQSLDLFSCRIDEATPDTLRVSINPRIPATKYDEIKQSLVNKEGKYDYFHIVAGNIHKRIKVTPLELIYYLKVNPTDITIDVALRLASGDYQGDIPVAINTNYPFVKVSLVDGWNALPESEFGGGVQPSAYPVKIQKMTYTNDPSEGPSFSNQVTVSGSQELPTTYQTMYYAVSFSGLNSGMDTWTENHTLTFKIEALLEEKGVAKESETVTLNIVPMILNYKIHFKAPAGEKNDFRWTNPHIYVYQCLEFPADYTGKFGNVSLASQPVGYYDQGDYFAALEYSFTGALAFRGWDFPYNYNLIYNASGNPKDFYGRKEKGFYVFNDGATNASWFPANRDEERYNFSMDFCEAYRKELSGCNDCKENINPVWPGIRMKYEGDGWFEFELTGIATPGKALIMFADGHTYTANMNRFPADNQVGIPLFDYPSKEGWFLYNSVITDRITNQFSPTKPMPIDYKCRIFWPKSLSETIHMWIQAGIEFTSWDQRDGVETIGDYNYRDFGAELYANNALNVMFPGLGNGKIYSLFMSTFQINNGIGGGRRCAYFDGTGFKSGVPPVN